MRKTAGFMLALLLLVPALASAWTLQGTVLGTSGSGQISINTTPAKVITVGTGYAYVATGADAVVTFTPAGSNVVTKVAVDGVTLPAVPASPYTVANNGKAHRIAVTFGAPLYTVTATQAAGGTVSLQQISPFVSGISRTSLGNIKPGASIKVTATPKSDQKVTSIIVDGTPSTFTQGAGVAAAVSFMVNKSQAVSATYAIVPNYSLVLKAPGNGVTGTPITLDAGSSTSNNSGLQFAFDVTGCGSFSQAASATPTFTFTPSAAGTCSAVLTATSTGDATGKTKSASIVVKSELDASNGACLTCHTQNNAPIVAAYNASTHKSSQWEVVSCSSCHSAAPHNTAPTYGAGTAAGCQTCHKPGTAYGIYSTTAGRFSAKAPHGEGLPSTGGTVDGTQKTQFLAQGAVCSDCHSHNNSINAGFAEGGHGHVSDVAMNPWTHYDWSARLNNGTRQNGNCDRCHTAGGFVKFLGNDPATATRLTPVPGVQAVLNCVGCHSSIETGALRTDAKPAGNPTPLTGGYFALFSSSASSITTGNTKIQVAFPGYKNSSICIPCHSGRTTDKVFVETYAKSAAGLKNYSTLQNSIYQHAKNMGQTFTGQGAYDFSGQLAAIGASSHAAIKMGAADTQGPCVGCHHTKPGASHSLEVVVSDASCSAVACHPAGFSANSLKVSEENYKAGVKALDALIRNKFAPLWASGSNDLAGERTGYWRYGRFMKTDGQAADLATAQKAYGAWYNWQILALYDSAAYAHNTNYARKILVDTIDYLDDGLINNSAPATIAGINTIVPGALTDAEKAAAADFTNGMATVKVMNRHADPSAAAYKVQYTLAGSTGSSPVTCATCHNPSNETVLQGEARKSWADSGHGETNALPWIPASNHLWRSSGFAASYADAASGSDCVRCHAAEGFAQFVSGPTPFTNVNAVASAANAAINSPLNCNTCHVNPINAASDRLAVPQVTIYYNISTANVQKTHLAATFPNVGESNMCIPCHAGRVSGAALADAAGKGFNFTTNSFQNSHYMAAAGLMYGKSGFTAFVPANTVVAGTTDSYGQTLTANEDMTVNTSGAAVAGKLTSTHRKLGTTAIRGDSHNPSFFVAGNLDTNGPCVTCHLQGYTNAGDKRPGAGHSLEIDAAAWNQVCNNCHAAEGIALVEEEKEPFDAAMNVLKSLVLSKLNCEYDSGAYPYFFKAGLPHTSANAFKAFGNVNNEGAAFNLNLLTREPFAYLHARTYARRLIYDTIDYLDDNTMNQSVKAYVESLGTYGLRPADASGATANDHLWQYLNKYDRTTKVWNAASERP